MNRDNNIVTSVMPISEIDMLVHVGANYVNSIESVFFPHFICGAVFHFF